MLWAKRVICFFIASWTFATAVGAPDLLTSGHAKRGLADYGSDCKGLEMVGAKWYYDWTLSPRNKCSGVEFVPMIWGEVQHRGGPPLPADPMDIAAKIGHSKDHKFLLGFNEPDHPEQSNIAPDKAAALWKSAVQPVAKMLGLMTVSPAVTCDSRGQTWLRNFFAECKGCTVDHVAFHCYHCDSDSFDSALKSFKAFNKPLWITEFACPSWEKSSYTAANNAKVMSHTFPMFDSDNHVFRYSWYQSMQYGRLWNSFQKYVTNLTDLGNKYKSLSSAVEIV